MERAIYRLQNVELTRFMVIDNVTEEPVGTVFAYDAHPDDGYCFFTVYTVPDFVGKGHGAEAAILMADYLFSNFSWLHKLYSDVYEYNTRSLRLNRKAGLQEEGCFREHRFYAGRRGICTASLSTAASGRSNGAPTYRSGTTRVSNQMGAKTSRI